MTGCGSPSDGTPDAFNAFQNLAEITAPVRCAHDVRVDDQRHDTRRILRIVVDLIELVGCADEILARRVMLDQHHRHVVAFLGIGDVDDRIGAGLEDHRLVVAHPVGDIVVAFLDQEVRNPLGADAFIGVPEPELSRVHPVKMAGIGFETGPGVEPTPEGLWGLQLFFVLGPAIGFWLSAIIAAA